MPIEGEGEIRTEKTSAETKKTKKDFHIELALLFILGALIGIAAKTEASKRFTMGFDDYKIKRSANQIDINELQQNLLEQQVATEIQEGEDQDKQ